MEKEDLKELLNYICNPELYLEKEEILLLKSIVKKKVKNSSNNLFWIFLGCYLDESLKRLDNSKKSKGKKNV